MPVLQWCLTLRRFVGLSAADLGDFFVPGCIVPSKKNSIRNHGYKIAMSLLTEYFEGWHNFAR